MFKKASQKKIKVKRKKSACTDKINNIDCTYGSTYDAKTTGQKGLCIQLKIASPHRRSAQHSSAARARHTLHQARGDIKQEIPQTTDMNPENFMKHLYK